MPIEHPATPGSCAPDSGTATQPRSSRSSSSSSAVRSSARGGGPARFAARVEYDGTDFAGYQVQPGRRTVQGELEAALMRISGGSRMRVDAAGRTDAGVHATGQVIAFTLARRMPVRQLARALDALLPGDVAIHALRRVDAGFNPRYAARYREYRYTVWNGPRSPLRERPALGGRGPPDASAPPSCARWSGASWPPSFASDAGRRPRTRSRRPSGRPDGRSQAPSPPPRGYACGGGGPGGAAAPGAGGRGG